MQLGDRVLGRNGDEAGGQGLHGLAIHGQDQAVEVAKLVIDAADGAAGSLGDIANLQ